MLYITYKFFVWAKFETKIFEQIIKKVWTLFVCLRRNQNKYVLGKYEYAAWRLHQLRRRRALFCKCLHAVINDRTLSVPQTDELNILKSWECLEQIDNEEMVGPPRFQLKFLKYAKVHVDGSLRRYFKDKMKRNFLTYVKYMYNIIYKCGAVIQLEECELVWIT